MTFYKVYDKTTGLYMTSGGGWSKTGKTWESLGRLKNALVAKGFYGKHRGKYHYTLPIDCEVVEVVVRHDEGNRTDLGDLIARERRLRDLTESQGSDFANLVRKIEDQGQTHQFQWALVTPSRWDYGSNQHAGAFAELMGILKELRLKQNKDYKKSSSYNGQGVVALSTKELAMRVRLMMTHPVKSFDIKEFIEVDLDEEAQESA